MVIEKQTVDFVFTVYVSITYIFEAGQNSMQFFSTLRIFIETKMSSSLSGCTVLVSGASAGIGAATAIHFAKYGDKIYGTNIKY